MEQSKVKLWQRLLCVTSKYSSDSLSTTLDSFLSTGRIEIGRNLSQWMNTELEMLNYINILSQLSRPITAVLSQEKKTEIFTNDQNDRSGIIFKKQISNLFVSLIELFIKNCRDI